MAFSCIPSLRAADITAFKAHLVPVGEDQRPMIEQTNEIVRHFNRLYKKDVLIECELLVPEMGARLVGLDGKAKMSKSLGNAIYLGDSEKQLKKKINKMFTDPRKIHVDDPGHLDGHVPFMYLDLFDPEKRPWPNSRPIIKREALETEPSSRGYLKFSMKNWPPFVKGERSFPRIKAKFWAF